MIQSRGERMNEWIWVFLLIAFIVWVIKTS